MVGAALLVVHGKIPLNAIDLALFAPVYLNFPMAPAEGLVLENAGFGRNPNGQVCYLFLLFFTFYVVLSIGNRVG
jgi:tRNA U38,U39,U40 pseudouridine synthase TruA